MFDTRPLIYHNKYSKFIVVYFGLCECIRICYIIYNSHTVIYTAQIDLIMAMNGVCCIYIRSHLIRTIHLLVVRSFHRPENGEKWHGKLLKLYNLLFISFHLLGSIHTKSCACVCVSDRHSKFQNQTENTNKTHANKHLISVVGLLHHAVHCIARTMPHPKEWVDAKAETSAAEKGGNGKTVKQILSDIRVQESQKCT